MKTQTAGQMIRRAREARRLTRPQLAKTLGISPGYLGHLERDGHVHLSQRIVGGLKIKIRLHLPAKAVDRANAAAARWYRAYRNKKAS